MYCTDTFVGGNKIFFSNFRNFEEMSPAPSLRNPGSTTALKYILLCLMNSKKNSFTKQIQQNITLGTCVLWTTFSDHFTTVLARHR